MSATHGTGGFGRGIVLLALANAVYVVGGYALTVVLARMLGAADFGGYGVVTAWVTVLTTLLVKGAPGAVTRALAEPGADRGTVFAAGRALLLRASFGLVVLGLAASPLVGRLVGGDDLVPLLAVGALGAASFGVNAMLLAWTVGVRDYGRQVAAQVAYSLLRVLLVLVGAAVADLPGAVVGYVLAPLASSIPLLVARPAPTGDVAAVRRQLRRASVPIIVTAAAVTAYFVVDIFALAVVAGGSSVPVGTYVAFGTLAHVPYFLLQATSVAMVPAIAAYERGPRRRAAIRTTVTDTIVLLAGPTLLLVTAGDAAARVVFDGSFVVDGLLVAPLALATAAITLHAGFIAVDTAIGRLAPTVALSVVGSLAVAVAAGVAAEQASTAAAASQVAWAVLVATAGVLLLHLALEIRRFGWTFAPRRAALGVLVAAAASLLPLLSTTDLTRLLLAVVGGIAWLVAVVALRLVDLRRGEADQDGVAPEVIEPGSA